MAAERTNTHCRWDSNANDRVFLELPDGRRVPLVVKTSNNYHEIFQVSENFPLVLTTTTTASQAVATSIPLASPVREASSSPPPARVATVLPAPVSSSARNSPVAKSTIGSIPSNPSGFLAPDAVVRARAQGQQAAAKPSIAPVVNSYEFPANQGYRSSENVTTARGPWPAQRFADGHPAVYAPPARRISSAATSPTSASSAIAWSQPPPMTGRILPPSGKIPDKNRKLYCTYWIRTGECDYQLQGCLYKHEMPSKQVLEQIGFHSVPQWYVAQYRSKLTVSAIRAAKEAEEAAAKARADAGFEDEEENEEDEEIGGARRSSFVPRERINGDRIAESRGLRPRIHPAMLSRPPIVDTMSADIQSPHLLPAGSSKSSVVDAMSAAHPRAIAAPADALSKSLAQVSLLGQAQSTSTATKSTGIALHTTVSRRSAVIPIREPPSPEPKQGSSNTTSTNLKSSFENTSIVHEDLLTFDTESSAAAKPTAAALMPAPALPAPRAQPAAAAPRNEEINHTKTTRNPNTMPPPSTSGLVSSRFATTKPKNGSDKGHSRASSSNAPTPPSSVASSLSERSGRKASSYGPGGRGVGSGGVRKSRKMMAGSAKKR